MLWYFVTGKKPATVIRQLPIADDVVRFDYRANTLSPICICKTDDGAVSHSAVLTQYFLHFSGGDILPATDDHVFLAINNIKVPLLVEAADIASM